MPANHPERNPGASRRKGATEEGWVAARALYESTPGITMAQVAEKIGASKSSVEKHAAAEGWVKCHKQPDNSKLNDEAHRLADSYQVKLAELGPEVSAEDKKAAADAVVVENAAEQRAKVIDRHRKEWNAPRALSAEAVRARDFERAKLAKITAETLKLVQDGERKAWGIDKVAEDGMTLVIERGKP